MDEDNSNDGTLQKSKKKKGLKKSSVHRTAGEKNAESNEEECSMDDQDQPYCKESWYKKSSSDDSVNEFLKAKKIRVCPKAENSLVRSDKKNRHQELSKLNRQNEGDDDYENIDIFSDERLTKFPDRNKKGKRLALPGPFKSQQKNKPSFFRTAKVQICGLFKAKLSFGKVL